MGGSGGQVPPDVLTTDNERGLISQEVVDKLSVSGTVLWPTAAYAPWQKGRVERRIHALKDTIQAVIMHKGLRGQCELEAAAMEAAHAYNSRPGGSGFTPGQRLFGTRPRAFAEVYRNGEHQGWHPSALDAGTETARRLELRRTAQELTAKRDYSELVARSLAARSRPLTTVVAGERVYFYRKMTPAQKRNDPGAEAARGAFVGPGLVVGMHGPASAWVQHGGRLF